MRKYLKRILLATAMVFAVCGAVIIPAGIASAWEVSAQATSSCDNGVAVITATFTNHEAPGSGLAMTVTLVNGKVAEGTQTVQPGATSQPFTVSTGQSSLSDASVTFEETWTNGQSGTDSVSVWVPSITCSVPVTTSPPAPTTTTTVPAPTPVPPVPTTTPPTVVVQTPPAPVAPVATPVPAPAPVVVTIGHTE